MLKDHGEGPRRAGSCPCLLRILQPLRDILEGARMIEDFTLGMSFEQFREDPKTVAAVERKFLVIGGAGVRLGREAPFIVADVPWRPNPRPG